MTSVVVHYWAGLLPFADRLQLAAVLVPERGDARGQPQGEDESERERPDWHQVWGTLLAGQTLATALARAPEWHESGVRFDRITEQAEKLSTTIGEAHELCSRTARTEELHVPWGIPQAHLGNRLARWQARQVDAALQRRAPRVPDDAARWVVDYRDSGAFLAQPEQPGPSNTSPYLMNGFGCTPLAAVDVVRQWFIGAEVPAVTVRSAHALTASRLVQFDPDADTTTVADWMDGTFGDTLDQGGPCYEATRAACETARRQLRREGPGQLIARRVAELNAGTPQLPWDPTLPHGVFDTARDGRFELNAWLHGTCWVPSHLVAATLNPVWGEFGDHRPEMVETIAVSLADDVPLEGFLRTFFGEGPIDLAQIPAWAGPLYQVSSNGNHRVHTARILEIPWLLATVSGSVMPTEFDVLALLDADQQSGERAYAERLDLLAGLLRRGIVEGELVTDAPESLACYGDKLVCTRLPAPWLLREPRYAARHNAIYESCYPGALQQVGIPTQVGTDPDAWASWLTEA